MVYLLLLNNNKCASLENYLFTLEVILDKQPADMQIDSFCYVLGYVNTINRESIPAISVLSTYFGEEKECLNIAQNYGYG